MNTRIVKMVVALFTSRKFYVLLFAVFASYGLPINAETQALIIFLAAATFAITTAWEDTRRNGGNNAS